MIQRSWLWQTADSLGYIPVFGSLTGLARLITALSLKVFACMTELALNSLSLQEYTTSWQLLSSRVNGEAYRGILELISSFFFIPFWLATGSATFSHYLDKQPFKNNFYALGSQVLIAQGRVRAYSV